VYNAFCFQHPAVLATFCCYVDAAVNHRRCRAAKKTRLLRTTHWMPATQFCAKDPAASPSSLVDCSSDATIMGLNTFSSKWPLLPATLMPAWLPITCGEQWKHYNML